MQTRWGWMEMKGAKIGDVRLRASLAAICEQRAVNLELSFSAALGPALRQAAQRIFRSPDLTAADLLAGHVARTVTRLPPGELVLVAQDTTEIDFTAHPATTGLGGLSGSRHSRGFLAHGALALSPTGVPWGLLHSAFWTRDLEKTGIKHTRHRRPTAEKESQKWLTTLAAVEQVVPVDQPVLLLQDREADLFAFLAAPRRATTHYLVRATHPRQVLLPAPTRVESAAPGPTAPGATATTAPIAPPPLTLWACAAAGTPVGTLQVPVVGSDKQPARDATVTVRVGAVILPPPQQQHRDEPQTPVAVWVLQAAEETPPAGVEPLCWVLLSSQPVTDGAHACTLVGYYALRWRIERLHYVLKSGCQIEKLQHGSFARLQKCVALHYVVAWQLLWCTYVARAEPTAPPERCLPSAYLQVLRAVTRRPVLTAGEVPIAIACLVGYAPQRNAAPPGVKRLWQGYRRLEDLVTGFTLHAQLYPS